MGTTVLSPESVSIGHDDLTPAYNVVLLDDDDHTYDYVIEMLQKLFVSSHDQAFQHAVQVDTHGRTILITCALPEAEYARDQVHAFGPHPRKPRSKGSMSAVIEPLKV